MKSNRGNTISVIDRLITALLLSTAVMPVIFFWKYSLDIFLLPKEFLFQTLVLAMLLLWLVKAIHEKKTTFVYSKLNLFILLYLTINALSVAWSTNLYLSLKAINNLSFRIILYFIIINTIESEKHINTAVNLLILAAGLESLYGVLQYYELDPFLGLKFEGKLNVIGTLGYHNYLSEWLVLIIPLMISKLFMKSVKTTRVLTVFALTASFIYLFLTQTRSAMLALLFSIPFMLIYIIRKKRISSIRNNRKIAAISIIIVVSALILMFMPVGRNTRSSFKRILSSFETRNGSVKSRIVLWKTGINMIKEKPLLGRGLDTYRFHFLDFLPEAKSHLTPAEFVPEEAEYTHNDFMQPWVETGIAGFLLFIVMFVMFFKEAIRTIKSAENNHISFTIIAFIAGIAGVLIISMFSFPFHVIPMNTTIWYIIGLTVAAGKINERKNSKT